MKRTAIASILAGLTCLIALPLTAADHLDFQGGKKLKVMTQNLYVGANLFRVLTPEEGNPFCDVTVRRTHLPPADRPCEALP